MSKVKDALDQTRQLKPQAKVDIVSGMKVRRTKGGLPVFSIHYTADPNKSTPEWKQQELRTYSSKAAWEREMEMVDEAGGGELVFADTLITYWNKIVITDPKYRPSEYWRVEGGFDHGKTNPTALERYYIDHDGVIIFCGEYYMPGKEIWEHAPEIKKMSDVKKIAACYADPTIFDMTQQQSQSSNTPVKERAKSFNELYVEQGIELFSPFAGDRSDISFAARIMQHWADLEHREPTLKIVCRNYSEQPQPGLHNWDCPNLLWEMMRRRRVKNTALQLMNRNPSEALVDRDNHGTDACKYGILSHPEPTLKTAKQLAAEKIKGLAEQQDLTSALIRYNDAVSEQEESNQPITLGRYGRRRV